MPKFAPVANPKQQSTESKTTCFHCGEVCNDHEFHLEDKYFCCFGCKTVYEILRDNDLCSYYDMQEHPGITQKNKVAAFCRCGQTKNKPFCDGSHVKIDFKG